MEERECTYCPEPGADVCVRMHTTSSGSGIAVFAHSTCAERRGVWTLYRVMPEVPAVTR